MFVTDIPTDQLADDLAATERGSGPDSQAAGILRDELKRRRLITDLIAAVAVENFEAASDLDSELQSLGCRLRLSDRGWRRHARPARRHHGCE